MYLLAPGPFGLGGWELLIIAFIIVLVFGVGRLPEVGGAVGKGLREFRKSARDDIDETQVNADGPSLQSSTSAGASPASTLNSVPSQPAASAPPPSEPVVTPPAASGETRFCSECGTRNARSAKFCANCGTAMAALTQ